MVRKKKFKPCQAYQKMPHHFDEINVTGRHQSVHFVWWHLLLSVFEMVFIHTTGVHPFLRMDLSWSSCILQLLVGQIAATVGDLGVLLLCPMLCVWCLLSAVNSPCKNLALICVPDDSYCWQLRCLVVCPMLCEWCPWIPFVCRLCLIGVRNHSAGLTCRPGLVKAVLTWTAKTKMVTATHTIRSDCNRWDWNTTQQNLLSHTDLSIPSTIDLCIKRWWHFAIQQNLRHTYTTWLTQL